MTTSKAKAGYMVVGALLTLFILYPALKGMRREQAQGLLLTPEEVRVRCGKPQAEDMYGYELIYIEDDRRVELQFMGANHRMYLNRVKWSSSKGGVGDIKQVTTNSISYFVKNGWLPSCLEELSQ